MKVFITAGEASGDKLAADLMAALRSLVPEVEFRGVAGPRMQGQGMVSEFPMEELSIMGLAEILPKYFHLKRRIKQTAQQIVDWNADVLITVDAPEFSLRLARAVKEKKNIKTVHYVAPTVWAWRPGRAQKMAAFIDHVLALFPFEPPYMTRAGMTCDFVGHPLASEAPVNQSDVSALRSQMGVEVSQKTMVVLPGSRKSELKRLLPVFESVLADPAFENTHLIWPTLPHLKSDLSEFTNQMKQNCSILDFADKTPSEAARSRLVAFAAGDVALAASGTVALELALAKTPMVVAYDMGWLSRQIIGRMLLIDSVNLVNLVSETRIVPEYIGKTCQPEGIISGLKSLIDDPKQQIEAMHLTYQRLGQGGEDPAIRAARSVLGAINRS